jgi:hypothetical protein
MGHYTISMTFSLKACCCYGRRTLDADFKFHPYKMMVVQELNKRDWVNRNDSFRLSCKMFQLMMLCAPVTKLTFICQDASTSRIFGNGRKTTLNNSMSDLYTANVLLFGVLLQILV